jgi:formate dehydrogenase subunit beta
MTTTVTLPVEGDFQSTLRGFFRTLLEMDPIDALFIPQRLPMKNMVMPALISDPDGVESIDPLAPAFPLNAARGVARLTRRPAGKKLAVVLRPCEMRAFVELVKLKQGTVDDILLIGFDCLGAYANRDYFRFVESAGDGGTAAFVQASLAQTAGPVDGIDLAPACQICEHFVPETADIHIGLLGVDTTKEVLVTAGTKNGTDLLAGMDTTPAEPPAGRQERIKTLKEQRTAARNACFADTAAATDSVEKLTTYLAHCVNCYNCRVACPVCYCKECVFVTDVFDHDASQYLQWARRKGTIKMPTDTVFYHLTRLAHMSTACVGCGQCSNACPNDIPVMELFRTVAHQAQAAFDYRAGRSVAEKPPLSTFKEDEFQEVVGITS